MNDTNPISLLAPKDSENVAKILAHFIKYDLERVLTNAIKEGLNSSIGMKSCDGSPNYLGVSLLESIKAGIKSLSQKSRQ